MLQFLVFSAIIAPFVWTVVDFVATPYEVQVLRFFVWTNFTTLYGIGGSLSGLFIDIRVLGTMALVAHFC